MSQEDLKQLEMLELGSEETLLRALKTGKDHIDQLTTQLSAKDQELQHLKSLLERTQRLSRDLESELKALREENRQLRRERGTKDLTYER
jgi:hypothetical protein